jgi:hypothetical protein
MRHARGAEVRSNFSWNVKPSVVVTREEIRQKLTDEPERFRDL